MAMSDKPEPAFRSYVTINELRWELVPTDKLTWPEVKEAKRVSGMALLDMEGGLLKADPDAWFAMLFVSIRRQWPTLTEKELEDAIGDTPIMAVLDSIEKEAPEVAGPVPPAKQPEPPTSVKRPDENGSGDETRQPSTLETVGPLT
jgi:hypothetical protein